VPIAAENRVVLVRAVQVVVAVASVDQRGHAQPAEIDLVIAVAAGDADSPDGSLVERADELPVVRDVHLAAGAERDVEVVALCGAHDGEHPALRQRGGRQQLPGFEGLDRLNGGTTDGRTLHGTTLLV
jgi:hypothetical protein